MSPESSESRLGFVLLISSVAALGGFLFGYDSGVINGAVEALQSSFQAGNMASGFNVASMLLGCAAGAFMAGRIADRFGRRAALFGAAVLFAISSWGAGIAGGSFEFVVYRVLGGLAVGAASVIAPAYIAEVAPAAYRGRLASLQQLAIVLGLFSAFLVNYLIAQAAGGAGELFWWGFPAWRWMFWAELVPVAFFFVGLCFIPESPRFLVAAHRLVEAEKILAQTAHPHDAPEKVKEIQATLTRDRPPSLVDVLEPKTGQVRKIVWVGIIIAALQQLVGINVVFYYGEVLWRAAGFTESDALKINVISGTINVGATVAAMALVDRWGRKPLLLVGSVGMALSLATLALLFGSAATGHGGRLELGPWQGPAALVVANLYIICFGISWGPVMWVMLGEMFPNQCRGAALALAGLSQWGANFLVTMTFPLLLGGIGLGGAYGIYAACAAASYFLVRSLVQETKGRTLEAMG
ncbi:MAG: sugar porter family MFS transporter [Verrucomicrobiia bacterium]